MRMPNTNLKERRNTATASRPTYGLLENRQMLAGDPWLYYLENNVISRASSDGSGAVPLVQANEPGWAITNFDIDPVNRRIIYAEGNGVNNSRIKSVDLLGQSPFLISQGQAGKINYSMAVDGLNQTVYLHSHDIPPLSSGPFFEGRIQKITYSGTLSLLPPTLWYVHDIEVEASANALYFTNDVNSEGLFKSDLNGNNSTQLANDSGEMRNVAFSRLMNKIVYTNAGESTNTSSIYLMNPDGSNKVKLGDYIGTGIEDVEIDDDNGFIYFSTILDGIFKTSVTNFSPVQVMPGQKREFELFNDSNNPPTINYISDLIIPENTGTTNPNWVERQYEVGTEVHSITSADFDGDGILDIASANINAHSVSLLLGNLDGTFDLPDANNHFTTGLGPRWITHADLNNDGYMDLITANRWSPPDGISVLINSGNDNTALQRFQPAVHYPTGTRSVAVVAADFNKDGLIDLATANIYSDDVSVLLGIGNGLFAPAQNYPAGDGATSVVAADFNNDGNLDLATVNEYANSVSVLTGTGTGSFHPALSFATASRPFFLMTADFDLDGQFDLAISTYTSPNIFIHLGSGNGSFDAAQTYFSGIGPGAIAPLDFNRDGLVDLAVVNSADNNVSLFSGEGDGTFSLFRRISAGRIPASIVSHDFDRDGLIDLAVGNYDSSNISVLLQRPGESVSLTGISAGDGDTQPIRITATSSNPGLIPHPLIDYFSPDARGNLRLLPNPNQIGAATITVTVEDGGFDGNLSTTADNATFSRTFQVTVTPVNDLPTLDALSNQTIYEDDAQQTVNLTGITAGGGEFQPLRVTATSDNTGLMPNPSVNYTSVNSTGSIIFTPVTNQFGTVTITVSVEDGGLDNDLNTSADNATFSRTFTVTVNPVNDPPTAITPAEFTLDERTDTTSGYLLGTLSADDVDSGDEHTFTIIGGPDQALFSVAGTRGEQLRLTDGVLRLSKPLYQVLVRVTDSAGVSYDQLLNVNVRDLLDVSQTIVNAGAAQRSSVHQLLVRFDGLVNHNNGAFQVNRLGPTVTSVGLSVSWTDHATYTEALIRFTSSVRTQVASPVQPKSLVDGEYELLINRAAVTRKVTGDTLSADYRFGGATRALDNFYALYGDATGTGVNGQVNNSDFILFRQSFGTNSLAFDFDGNGTVNNTDFIRFRQNFGSRRF
jgi:hypothetical protein